MVCGRADKRTGLIFPMSRKKRGKQRGEDGRLAISYACQWRNNALSTTNVPNTLSTQSKSRGLMVVGIAHNCYHNHHSALYPKWTCARATNGEYLALSPDRA
eukprot:1707279-Pyramimonas_sp.AAC.1